MTAPCWEEPRREEGRDEDGGGAVLERWRAVGLDFGFGLGLGLGFTSDSSELSLSSLEQGTYLSSEISRSAKKALGMGRSAATRGARQLSIDREKTDTD